MHRFEKKTMKTSKLKIHGDIGKVTKVQGQDSIKCMHTVVAKTEQASAITMTPALYRCTI